MSKTTKKELQRAIQRQESRIDGVVGLLAKRGYYDKEPKSQLKQLDQSIFDGLDEKWQFAAVDDDGRAYAFMQKPIIDQDSPWFIVEDTTKCNWIGEGYDASNWRNSLIERSSLAKELTGSELCKAMLARGDKYVMCLVSPYRDAIGNDSIILPKIVTAFHEHKFITTNGKWAQAIPINNQGKLLTQAEVGL